MPYFVIIVSLIVAGYFVWTNIEEKREKKKAKMKHEEKPLFRSEEDLEEYGKPMDSHPVDFDDAE